MLDNPTAHDSDAARLLDVANRLRAAADSPCAANGTPLPALLFLTDARRTPDPVANIRRLPHGVGVVLRHYDHPARTALALEVAALCRAQGRLLLIGGDVALAREVGAHGVHLPEHRIDAWRDVPGIGVVTAAVHSEAALQRAAERAIDAVLLSPVFVTASDPAKDPLGVARLRTLVAAASMPVFALGGITAANADKLIGSGAAGIAAIGALAS